MLSQPYGAGVGHHLPGLRQEATRVWESSLTSGRLTTQHGVTAACVPYTQLGHEEISLCSSSPSYRIALPESWWGTALWRPFPQELGILQGSVLSVSLIGLSINNTPSCLPRDIQCAIYVDDFSIIYGSPPLYVAEQHIQLALSQVIRWADSHRFRFSPTKTVTVHFHTSKVPYATKSLFLWYKTSTNWADMLFGHDFWLSSHMLISFTRPENCVHKLLTLLCVPSYLISQIVVPAHVAIEDDELADQGSKPPHFIRLLPAPLYRCYPFIKSAVRVFW